MSTVRWYHLLATIALLLAVEMPTTAAQRAPLPPWREPLPPALPVVELTVGGVPILAEVAISPDEQALGLGFRNGIEADRGMLFVFQEPVEIGFWLDGMRFCLDIIWIAGDEITGAEESVCPASPGTESADLPSYLPDGPVTHVLEMPAGWLAIHGFGPGTPVAIPESLT